MYTFTRTLAGIRQEKGKIVIRPRLLDLPDLSGTVITPLGPVQYRYRKTADQGWRYEIILPEQAEGRLVLSESGQISFAGKLSYAAQQG